MPSPVPDPWLTRWLPLIHRHAAGAPVLELGCGSGADTATLTAAGLQVVAVELSAAAAARAQQAAPTARVLVQDVRAEFPPTAAAPGVVLASLSLHYFCWAETQALFDRIRQTLAPGGLFVCRLNASDDVHFGATGHPAIEPGYFNVDGQLKRFFSQDDIDRLLGGHWQQLSLEHRHTGKYGAPKALWELVCRPVPA